MARLFSPIDIASLVYFRIAFGGLMIWEVWRYFSKGWIPRYFIDPIFHFKYYGFEWVHPWPGQGMYWHFAFLGLFAFFILIGFCYRVSAFFFFLGFTYVFLIDQATYLNHFYLICLVSFLMIFVPAHRALSVDAWLQPSLRSETAPAWALWLLRFQVAVAYFFGGVAKLNGDWLRGEPMRMWLANHTDFPLIGHTFTQQWATYFFSYGGLLFDLGIVFLLLWRKTRLLGYLLVVFFNLMNATLFRIGVFPWFMIAATALFFEPDWPRRVLGWKRETDEQEKPAAAGPLTPTQKAVLSLLGLYVAAQILIPFRHFLYSGNVSWTEEGHRFSWHMKLRSKRSKAEFLATDPVLQKTWTVSPDDYLTRRQIRAMIARPDMIHQFCVFLGKTLGAKEGRPIEIRAKIWSSLNDRPAQWLIDPERNLAAEPRSLKTVTWIIPLQDRETHDAEEEPPDDPLPEGE